LLQILEGVFILGSEASEVNAEHVKTFFLSTAISCTFLQKREYQNVCFMATLDMRFWNEQGSPVWNVLTAAPPMLNEKRGEETLGALTGRLRNASSDVTALNATNMYRKYGHDQMKKTDRIKRLKSGRRKEAPSGVHTDVGKEVVDRAARWLHEQFGQSTHRLSVTEQDNHHYKPSDKDVEIGPDGEYPFAPSLLNQCNLLEDFRLTIARWSQQNIQNARNKVLFGQLWENCLVPEDNIE